jgi:hypothetical protein
MEHMNCKKCETKIPDARYHMGYDVCVNCSTEEKVSCHTIYPHKTGGYIQVVSKEQSQRLNKLDRRGYKGTKTFSVPSVKFKDKEEKVKVERTSSHVEKIILLSDKDSTTKVLDYYDEWGYQPTIKYLKRLSSKGDIALTQRVRLQDMITELEMTPTTRALSRKFNKKNFSLTRNYD